MDELDFSLTDGASYYADNGVYEDHLRQMEELPEVPEEVSAVVY